MNKAVAAGNADRLIAGLQVHIGRLAGRQGFGQRHQIGGGQIIGHHFQYGCRPQRARMQNATAHFGEVRQHHIKGGPVTAREDRNIARGRAVTPARDRTVDSRAAKSSQFFSQPVNFCLVSCAHLCPDFTCRKAGQQPVFIFHHRSADRRRRQTGDQNITTLCHLFRAVRPFRALVQKRRGRRPVQITDGQIDTISEQRAGQFGPDIPQPDKTNLFVICCLSHWRAPEK